MIMMTEPQSAPHRVSILWRDETAVAVNKPAGLLVHNSKWAGPKETSLRQIVARQLGQQTFPVHRLDRPTSGVLLYALSSEAARRWHEQLRRPDTVKRYLALARGRIDEPVTIDRPLKEGKTPRPAVTHITPLAYQPEEDVTLVVARIETGRRHQIRRHLSRIAHQLIGDTTYGKGRINRYFRQAYDLHRLFLHAWTLDIVHPYTEQPLHLRAELPPELQRVLQQLFPAGVPLPDDGT
jgi:tRNA pseudouridine65 synthase